MHIRPTTSCFGVDLESSELYADDHHWGDKQVDVRAHNLPALKARYLLEHLPSTGRVLEVGCGGGRLLNTVAAWRPQLDLDGCDIRPLHYTPTHFHFTPVRLDEVDLPYPPGTFDVVLMVDALEHFADPAAALRAARAVLRPRGRLISFTPLEGQPLSFYRVFRRFLGDDLYARTKEHIQAFSESSLRGLLARDFELIDHAYAYHLLGHLMDATLFALLTSPRLRSRFWEDNPFYQEVECGARGGGGRSPLGVALRVANAIAYVESRSLRRVRYGAAGFMFVAAPRP
jgi:SAM-dependent methyltransferase